MNTWQAAWVLSSLMAGGIFFFSKKSRLTFIESLLLAIAWFPAPLFYAVKGSNSVVYLFDFAVPFALYFAIERWKFVPQNIRVVSGLLFFSAGFMPVFTAIGYATQQVTFLLALINMYRLIGAMSLLVYFSAIRPNRPIKQTWIMTGFVWGCLVIILAMFLQGQEYVNSNVLEAIRAVTDPNYIRYENDLNQKFIVLGMFRGSLGILGGLAVALSITKNPKAEFPPFLRLISGISGILIIFLTGSKTALVSVVFIVLLVILSRGSFSSRITALVVSLITAGAVFFVFTSSDAFKYIPVGMRDIITSKGSSAETLDSRIIRYIESFKTLNEHPEILTGFISELPFYSGTRELNLSYFHNEYLSILMLGGIWSITTYVVGLWKMGQLFFFQKNQYLGFQNFAGLLFIESIVQGLSVAHLQPALLFVTPVAISCCIYGFGSIPEYKQVKIADDRALVNTREKSKFKFN
ncbi:O-antigen ligase family protein [Coleofasciculus sp. FACHB-64]|uniref:O-antigen ligase family protein n=1 Tax=Cyanophyceae TaxID=3028117 RepID=UPI001682FF8F|nr:MULTISPECIES: O-antigen ligase family protein [unclassified Coleofasciculus]MBD1840932.1 O-antigen ligase family protein [Coleofasciculus sp. FACHB-501]MBD1889376.1 O-antigen ligase family protein [Coleofasciculus sp. FACHB-SPT9]MBD2046055.1 O-antigen ligase family protein [Coleofasciculus sp. FACHB-64]